MKDFRKLWKELSRDQKAEWQKKYHLNRDKANFDHRDSFTRVYTSNSADFLIQVINTSSNANYDTSAASINMTQIINDSDIGDFNFICPCENNIGSNPKCYNCNIISLNAK